MSTRFSYQNLVDRLSDFLVNISKINSELFRVHILDKTFLGHNIYLITLGRGRKEILLSAAFHGMEDITARILMQFADDILNSYNENSEKILHILNEVTIFIVPMVNPDGVCISLNGITRYHSIYNSILSINDNNPDFTKWQANANGVDINHNFDAGFELSREFEAKHGIYGPAPTRYAGEFPESEIESRTLAELVRRHLFECVLAFHSQGEEIYYSFNDKIPPGSEELVERFERTSGYCAEIPDGIASFGGFKDWFIKEFNRPGFTIEVGLGENPLPPSQFESIYPKAKGIILEAIEFAGRDKASCS